MPIRIVKIKPNLFNVPIQKLSDDDLIEIFEHHLGSAIYKKFVLVTIPEAELSAEHALSAKAELLKRLKSKQSAT